MKKKLQIIFVLSFLCLSGNVFSQEDTLETNNSEPVKNTTKFTNAEKEFNDWYVSLFLGANALQNTDLVSWGDGRFIPGYDVQLQVTKEVTHAFGIAFMGQYGNTRQYGEGNQLNYVNAWDGKTEYYGLSLLGDLNLSMLFRRIDNNSPYRWAWHIYAGAGIIAYKTERKARYDYGDGSLYNQWRTVDDIKLNDRSVFAQVGTGLRYKLSPRFDLEMRAMYVMTGDESFDASGNPIPGEWTLADVEEGRDDNMITLSLGLHYKIGRHKESLQWHDPLKNLVMASAAEAVPCNDEDNDGVCDAQDKCPGTPEGIKVDGAGCPLDSDFDGTPDSADECPTIPGPPTNNGCPLPVVEVSIENIIDNLNQLLEGIEFDYDKDVIRTISYPKLNAAFDVLEAHPNYRFYVEGHTDAAGSAQYNQNLSERRAASVVRYLVNRGVPTTQLVPVGKGESDLKHPECDPTTNCPPWKNLENRRVIFKPYGESIENLEIKE